MSRLLRALLPVVAMGFLLPTNSLAAQGCALPFDTAAALKSGYTMPEVASYLRGQCDSILAAKAAYEKAVFANTKRLQEQGVPQRSPGETIERYLQRTGGERSSCLDRDRLESAGLSLQEIADYKRLCERKADRWDVLVNGGIDPDSATAQVEREFNEEAAKQRKRDLLERILWGFPIATLAAVLVVLVRGVTVKAWVGRLHGGQIFILIGALCGAGFLPMVVDIVDDELHLWVLGFIPVGAISAVLVLWVWFGARAKPKGDACAVHASGMPP